MRDNKRLLTVIILAVILIGAGMAFLLTGRGEQPVQVIVPDPVEEVAIADTAVPTIEVLEEAEDNQPEGEETQVAPTPRVGLEATDPAIVNLSSGDIQLIEVFAFW